MPGGIGQDMHWTHYLLNKAQKKLLPEINLESEQHFKENMFYVTCCPHHRENTDVEVSEDTHFLRRIGKDINVRGRVFVILPSSQITTIDLTNL